MESPVLTFSCVTFAIRCGVRRFRRPSSSFPPQNQALPLGVPDICGNAARLGKLEESPLGSSLIVDEI